jgi:hypothetical protein
VALGAAGLAVLAVAGLVAALLVWSPWQRPAALPGPAPSPVQPSPSDPDGALRERLGGLANLLIGDDPLLRACADPGQPVPAVEIPPGADPVATVTAQTEALRELVLDQPPEVRLLEDAEMTAQVAEFFQERGERERIELDTRALTALGAIRPGTDLAALRVEAFAEQVSGYHIGNEGLIGIRVGQPERLSPLERVVLAHEVEHALSFQRLGRPAGRPESADARRARSALVEGSASATMLQYATAVLSPAEQSIMRDELRIRAEQQALSGYRPYLLAELRFPYHEGLRYICQRWLAGGWEAVRAAYSDPPASTAAILFPDREGEQPRQPAPLSDPGRPWRQADTSSFGAAELEWLLAAPGGDPGAGLDRTRERVSAWDGGVRTVWTDQAATALGLALVDRDQRGPRLCDTVRQWYAAAFPHSAVDRDGPRVRFDGWRQDAVLTCPGSQVRLGIAPSLVEAAAIVAGAEPEPGR